LYYTGNGERGCSTGRHNGNVLINGISGICPENQMANPQKPRGFVKKYLKFNAGDVTWFPVLLRPVGDVMRG
jgi:hypothetical protein